METEKTRKPWQILTGSQLKFIAVVLMVFDHVHQMFIDQVPDWFTAVGRLVAPIFLFTLAEGFYYTRSKGKYMLRLFSGSLFMIIASSIIQKALPSETIVLMNNIFATMLVASIYMLAIDLFKASRREKSGKKAALGIVLAVAPLVASAVALLIVSNDDLMINGNRVVVSLMIHAISAMPNVILVEGGPILVFLAVLFYIFHGKPLLQVLSLALATIPSVLNPSTQALMIFAAIFILMYNGKKGSGHKWFFYIFYPAHIYILYILSVLTIGR